MLDELLDVFERDRRSHGRKKPRRGLRGLLARFVNDDHDDRDRERRRYDDDRYDDDRYKRRERRRYDFDD
jgi:hypothetical protein